MDVWVNFTHATKWQAEGIFKCFFPFKSSTAVATASANASNPKDASQKNLPVPKRKAFAHAIPLLTEDEISELAKRFAESIPEDELSVSEKRRATSEINLALLEPELGVLTGLLLQ